MKNWAKDRLLYTLCAVTIMAAPLEWYLLDRTRYQDNSINQNEQDIRNLRKTLRQKQEQKQIKPEEPKVIPKQRGYEPEVPELPLEPRKEDHGDLIVKVCTTHSPKIRTARERDKFSYLNVYDGKIAKSINYFSKMHGIELPKNLVKAMIAKEAGGHRKTAFVYDPMQIANDGDHALETLAKRKEHTFLIGDFKVLKGKKKTPRRNGEWDYSNSNMTAEVSIFGGIGWLYEKAAIFEVDKKSGRVYIAGWRNWEEALARYNGGGNSNYVQQISDTQKELNSYEKKGEDLLASCNRNPRDTLNSHN